MTGRIPAELEPDLSRVNSPDPTSHPHACHQMARASLLGEAALRHARPGGQPFLAALQETGGDPVQDERQVHGGADGARRLVQVRGPERDADAHPEHLRLGGVGQEHRGRGRLERQQQPLRIRPAEPQLRVDRRSAAPAVLPGVVPVLDGLLGGGAAPRLLHHSGRSAPVANVFRVDVLYFSVCGAPRWFRVNVCVLDDFYFSQLLSWEFGCV